MEIKCFKQGKDYTCAVACLRMILDFYGKFFEEAYLEKLCKTTKQGTTAENVLKAAEEIGFRGLICEGDLELLKACVSANTPVIVYLRLKFLMKYRIDTIHAMVVTNLDKKFVYLNDPGIGEEVKVKREEFLKSWGTLCNLMILIKPKK